MSFDALTYLTKSHLFDLELLHRIKVNVIHWLNKLVTDDKFCFSFFMLMWVEKNTLFWVWTILY